MPVGAGAAVHAGLNVLRAARAGREAVLVAVLAQGGLRGETAGYGKGGALA